MFKYGFRSIETAGFGWVGTLDALAVLALAGSHVALRKKQSAHQLGEREGEGASMTLADARAVHLPAGNIIFQHNRPVAPAARAVAAAAALPVCLPACLPARSAPGDRR